MRFRVALVVAVLGLALVALLVEFKRVLQRPRRGAQPQPPAEAEVEPPIAPAPEPSPSSPSSSSYWGASLRPAPPRRPTRVGVAHLKGRVVAPAGDEQLASDLADALEQLTIVADNGRGSFRAQRKPGSDRFELHLPPGRYTLTANAGDLVGVEPNVWLADGVAREVTITLEPAVRVTGRIRGAAPDDVSSMVLYAVRPGTTFKQGRGELDGDSFTFSGLRADHSYDLVFGGGGIRTTTIRGVSAPLEGLEVTLARLPVLRGAVGFARGTLCPLTRVRVAVIAPDDRAASTRLRHDNDNDNDGDDDSSDGDGDASADLEGDCRFELTLPADQPEVTVIATGPGWDIEERIAVPPEGDPPPVCLNPPCRSDPLEGLANLVVRFDVPGNRLPSWMMSAEVGEQGCTSGEASCRITGVAVGEPIELAARGQGCIPETRTLTLGAGENATSFSCRTAAPAAPADPSPLAALRRVQGILRTAGEAPEHLLIRCAGAGRERDLRNTLVFSTVCPRETAMLEYQLQREGPWTGVPIPTAADPALVEIAVGL